MEGQYYGFMESVRGSFMRILVCGGRDFDDPYLFAETLVEYDKPIIITGYDPEKEVVRIRWRIFLLLCGI
jgi:hypothetical protein